LDKLSIESHATYIYSLVISPLKSFVRKFRPTQFHKIDSRATIVALLTPGFLKVVYWLTAGCFDDEHDYRSNWKWVLLFNPILYPISNIGWHLVSIL
jgi:hypothetical protein